MEVTSSDLTSMAVARPGTSLFTTALVAYHIINQSVSQSINLASKSANLHQGEKFLNRDARTRVSDHTAAMTVKHH